MINKGALRIGVGQTDITPEKDIILGGATISGKIKVDYIKDPLYAKVMIVEADRRKLCIVTLDLLMITRKYVEQIRDEVHRRWDFERDAVLIHATQNHKAPSLGHFKISEDYRGVPEQFDWLRGGDENYHPYAFQQIMEAIGKAHDSMQPAIMSAASGIEGRWAFNRRMVLKDGKVEMPSFSGPPNPQSRFLEGPMDPELGVVGFRTDSMSWIGLLLSYTCHPVHQIGEFFISADWPGALSDRMRERCGRQCVPLVLNGACGNINPWDPYADAPQDNAGKMGAALAQSVWSILEKTEDAHNPVLDWKVRRIQIPLRELDENEVAAAKAYVLEHPTPRWLNDVVADDRWVYASGLLDLHEQAERQSLYDYEIQVLRIGNTAWVGLPGEPFAEGGLQIKLGSPALLTFIVHNTQFAGYIPTRDAFKHGGYETRTSNWSKFAPEALDMIVHASIEVLRELFQTSR